MADTENANALRIRMYNVGFGDCFLLFIPTQNGERTMLLDCGKHMSSKTGHAISDAAEDIVRTVGNSGRPRLDVVVATHRHYDHISGFDLKLWDEVEVGEVWMPWTEEVGDPEADRIRHNQNRFAEALKERFASKDTAIGALALNSLSNKGAEKRLRTGFLGQAQRRYLPARDAGMQVLTPDVLPGVWVHVLGPSRDPDVIALMDPPKGKYFPDEPTTQADGAPPPAPHTGATVAETSSVDTSFPHIFAMHYRMDAHAFRSRYAGLADHTDPDVLDEQSKANMLAAASGLEDAINGTSLVFALDFGTDCVLLAGDAEWGTWSKVLDDLTTRQLLGRTRAYKVSHHGSYNGTPKPFVDALLPDDALSLVSLGPMDKWPSIPRQSLLKALERSPRRLMRSDQQAPTAADVSSNGDLWVEVSIPVE
jgi:beta-lactamase superfamily II metal-dependent hydrolase